MQFAVQAAMKGISQQPIYGKLRHCYRQGFAKVTQAATHISRIQGHKATLVVNADIQENSLNSLRTHKRAEVSANQFKC